MPPLPGPRASLRASVLALGLLLGSLLLLGCPRDVTDGEHFRCDGDQDCLTGYLCVLVAAAAYGQCVARSSAPDVAPNPPDAGEIDGADPVAADTAVAPATLALRLHPLPTCGFEADSPPFEKSANGFVRVVGASGQVEVPAPPEASLALDGLHGVTPPLRVEVVWSDAAGVVRWRGARDGVTLNGGPVDVVVAPAGRYACPTLPLDMHHVLHPTVTALEDGRLLAVGGWRFTGVEEQSDQLRLVGEASSAAWVYDVHTGVWTSAGTLPAARGGHGAAWVVGPDDEGRVLVVGGSEAFTLDQRPGAGGAPAVGASGAATTDGYLGGHDLQWLDGEELALQGRLFPTVAAVGPSRLLVCGAHPGVASPERCDLVDVASGEVHALELAHGRAWHSAAPLPGFPPGRHLYYGATATDGAFAPGEVYLPASGAGYGRFELIDDQSQDVVGVPALVALGGDAHLAIGLVSAKGGKPGNSNIGGARRLRTEFGGAGYVLTAQPVDGDPGARVWGAVEVLEDGRVLVLGGYRTGPSGRWEARFDVSLYDPETSRFGPGMATGAETVPMGGSAVRALPGGGALLVGGWSALGKVTSGAAPPVMVWTPPL